MKSKKALTAMAVLTFGVAALAAAQQKEIPGELKTVMGSVEAIDHNNRVGTIAAQRKMTVTVTAIDHAKGVATVEGPNGYKYSRRIQDPEAAKKVKVGDRLDITWTEAVHIAVNP